MTDERFEELLREAAAGYREPPETPREEIWMAIERRRRERQRPDRGHWTWWGAGLAAALVLGVAIGRSWSPGVAGPSGAVMDRAASVPFEVAALEHLRRAETFLTAFRVDARTDRPAAWSQEPAHELLTATRLFLDSPASDDAQLRGLLDDLELVLAQIAQYRTERGRAGEELQLIDNGIERRGVMLRLRTAIDENAPAHAGQGVL